MFHQVVTIQHTEKFAEERNSKMLDNAFKKNLLRLLEEKGMTKTELSRKSGVLQAAISQYIHNDREPNYYTLYLLANALEVEVGEFYKGI